MGNEPELPGITRADGGNFISAATITAWVGIAGTVVTIFLTVVNTYTKSLIDKREDDLKALEYKLKEKSTELDASKERVERYKWVMTLFPDLEGADEKKKNFSISLIRLALNKEEAQQLFTGLQSSGDKELQNVGQSGIRVIEDEPIALLVSQMNANTANERKSAVAKLERYYKSSSQAINMVLNIFDESKVNSLSLSGVINGLYFLSSTDPNAWNKQNTTIANQLINRYEPKALGPQTRASLNTFKEFLKKIPVNL
jgi:hypothetical protein